VAIKLDGRARQAANSPRESVLARPSGIIEALGDFFAGATVEVAEQHHLAATLGEHAHRFGEGFAVLATLHGLATVGGLSRRGGR